MLKSLLLVLAGLVAGLAIAFWLAPGSEPGFVEPLDTSNTTAARPPPVSDTLAAARIAALEDALDAEILERAALEERVDALAARLAALGERGAGAPPGAGSDGGPPRDPAAVAEFRARLRGDPAERREEAERRFVERLVAEGFTPDRAEWLVRRSEELRMEALQAQYDAQRGVRPATPGTMPSLRAELGDADYERYLRAEGRPTAVPVRDVLASSPAERSGLRPGDEIVSYAGRRVFDMRELNALTLEGTPGESVAVEVRRNGQLVQVVLPRGPLGITGGGFRGR
jgi:hypothetical protein